MWIKVTEQCLALYPMDKIRDYEKQVKEMEETQKILEELYENQTALYKEESELTTNEPEFYSEDKSDLHELPEILPEEEYPEYPPPQANTDYDYTKFEVITANTTEDDEIEEIYGEEYEDYYGEFFPVEAREKRDAGEVLEGLMESGGKLLNGNMVGSLTSFLKTLAKPVFQYFIKSDNDHAMTKFTHRVLPETGFKGSPKVIEISRAAQQGDGEGVWTKLAENSRQWNPRSSYKNDRFHQSEIHRECRRNIQILDRNLRSRLKSVSLLVTSLMTSLHNTTVSDLNRRFKEATLHFKKITEATQQILKTTSNGQDTKTILKLMESTAKVMQKVVEEISDDAWRIIELTMAGATIVFIMMIIIILIKLNHDVKLIMAEVKKLQELNSTTGQANTPERTRENQTQEMRDAIMVAVSEAVETTVRNTMRTQGAVLERAGSLP